ncbi:hypothetical protein ACHAXT_005501 [Thalassiosira profunda]
MPSMRSFRSVTALLWGIVVAQTSVSTPRRPPVAFHSPAHWRLLVHRRCTHIDQRCTHIDQNVCRARAASPSLAFSKSNPSFVDRIAQALGLDQSFGEKIPLSTQLVSADPKRAEGQVVRTAARPHQSSGGSIPSSHHYTTRKPSLPMISVSDAGVTGDYNHYRTVALKSTANRAISILTRDVSSYIQTLDGGSFAKEGGYRDGDLGENVLVEGVTFDFFQIGQRYRLGGDATGEMESVVVEITEEMEPCANLCKLPYINDPSLGSPKDRVSRCQFLLDALGQKPGMRGWYARVIQDGVIRVGDSLSALGAVA